MVPIVCPILFSPAAPSIFSATAAAAAGFITAANANFGRKKQYHFGRKSSNLFGTSCPAATVRTVSGLTLLWTGLILYILGTLIGTASGTFWMLLGSLLNLADSPARPVHLPHVQPQPDEASGGKPPLRVGLRPQQDAASSGEEPLQEPQAIQVLPLPQLQGVAPSAPRQGRCDRHLQPLPHQLHPKILAGQCPCAKLRARRARSLGCRGHVAWPGFYRRSATEPRGSRSGRAKALHPSALARRGVEGHVAAGFYRRSAAWASRLAGLAEQKPCTLLCAGARGRRGHVASRGFTAARQRASRLAGLAGLKPCTLLCAGAQGRRGTCGLAWVLPPWHDGCHGSPVWCSFPVS